VRDLNKKIAQANKVKIDALKQQKALSDKKLEKTTKEKNLANKKKNRGIKGKGKSMAKRFKQEKKPQDLLIKQLMLLLL